MTATSVPTPELAHALAQLGIQPVGITLLSPLGIAKGRRLAYRVDGAGGERIKLRQFETEAAAREVYELRRGLETAFAPAIERYGAVVVEEWIEGETLAPAEAGDRVEEAGALLGRLHASPLSPDVPAELSTSKWRRGAESDVGILARAGMLVDREAAHLLNALNERDPLAAQATLIHLDFCAENLILDRRGALRVVDNEQVAIEPAGLDLGRTFHRWPMPETAWRRFCRGYRSSGLSLPGATGFWRLVSVLVGARVFLRCSPERLEVSMVLLRRLINGEDLEDQPT